MDDSRRHFDSVSRPARRGFATSELEEATGFNRRTIAYYVQQGLLPRVGRHGPRTRYPRFVRDRLLFIRRVREAEEAGELPPVSLAELRTAFARLPRRVVAAVADGAIAVSQELVAGEVGALVAGQVGTLAVPSLFRSAAQRQRVLEDRMRDPRRGPDVVEPSGEPPGELSGEPPAPAASAPAMPTPAVPPPAAPAVLEPGVFYSLRPPSAAASGDEKADDRAAKVLGVALAAVSNAARRREEASPQPVDTWMRAEVMPGVELSVRCATEEDRELLEQAAASLRSLVSKGEAQ